MDPEKSSPGRGPPTNDSNISLKSECCQNLSLIRPAAPKLLWPHPTRAGAPWLRKIDKRKSWPAPGPFRHISDIMAKTECCQSFSLIRSADPELGRHLPALRGLPRAPWLRKVDQEISSPAQGPVWPVRDLMSSPGNSQSIGLIRPSDPELGRHSLAGPCDPSSLCQTDQQKACQAQGRIRPIPDSIPLPGCGKSVSPIRAADP